MTRGRLLGLAAVLVLLAGAFLVGARDRTPSPAAAAPPSLAAAQAAARLPGCPPGLTTALPRLVLPCYGGGPDVQASQPPGRPMLVNLWATWCGPCVQEVPELVQFAQQAGDRVGVVGVVQLDSAASVYAFAKTFGITYPLVRDDQGDTLRHFGQAAPITVLVAADGRVADVHVGAFASLDAVKEAVAAGLGVRV